MRETWAQKKARYKKRQAPFRKAQLAKRVKKLELAGEKRFIDVASGTLQPTTAAVFTLLNGVASGDQAETRSGDQVAWDSLYLRFSANAYTANDNSLIRIMIVYDKQPNLAIFTMTNLLKVTTAILNINSPLDLDQSFRFKVILDKVIKIQNNSAGNVFFKKFINLSPLQTRYKDAGSVITSISTGSIYMLVFGDVALGDYQWYSRIRWSDS